MYLKKIELFGFKSFADKTEIVFEKGITAVVGPNGCGKSNISDAIRWVLGERSAKTLRGGKMEDVIFDGTQFRKPQGLAEVHLTIDNHDRGLPIAFDEVVISRKLYRSGESEYLINKTVCRMKDIQDLILDTGIGSSAYSMIEQGKIDYILNAEEEERRFLIEEAAGISKYKLKKDEALRKLERTEANLLRLQDIVVEVEKNINYAERQARRAAKYKEQFDRLKKLETQKAFLDIAALEAEQTQLESQITSLNEELTKYDSEIREKTESLGAVQSQMNVLEQDKSAVDQKKYEKMLKLSEFTSRMQANAEKKATTEAESSDLEKELSLGDDKIRNYQSEISQKESQSATLTEERETWAKETEIVRQQYDHIHQLAREEEEKVKRLRNRIFELAGMTTQQRNLRMDLEISRERQITRKEQAVRLLDKLNQDLSSTTEKLASFSQDPEIDRVIAEKAALRDTLTQTGNALEQQEQETEEAILSAKIIIQKYLSQLEMAHSLASQESPSLTAANVFFESLSGQGSDFDQVTRKFCSLFQIREGFEPLIHSCLKNWLHSILLEQPDQTLSLLDRIKTQDLRNFRLLVRTSVPQPRMSDLRPAHLPGFIAFARDLITCPSEYQSFCDAWFDNTVIVASLSREFLDYWQNSSTPVKIITRDGFLLLPGGKIEYFGNASLEAASLSESSPEVLQNQISASESELATLQTTLAKNRETQTLTKNELTALERELIENQIQTESAARMKESLEIQLKRVSEEIEFYNSEVLEAESEISRIQGERDVLDRAIQELGEKELEEQKQLEILTQAFNELIQKKEELLARVTEYTKRLERFNDQSRFLQESLVMLRTSEHSEAEAQDKRRRRLEDNRLLLIKIVEELSQAEPIRSEFDREISLLEAEIAEFNVQRHRFSDERDSLAQYVQELRTLHEKQKENHHKFDLHKMELAYKIQSIEERLLGTYQINLKLLDKANFNLENVNRDELDAEVAQLKEKLDSIGTVNLLAVDEYEQLKERFSFLSAQKQDLEKAREELLEAIRKINRTTKQLFEQTFLAVKTAFEEYFRILFAGGNAEMIMVDETNPLESGIEIMAKPPGKKLQRISLLSGGEKALTVIALLFSLFKVRPSPFCVLDEVDAPLDESNVDRFLQVVRSFLSTTQFIMVTHNRKSISAADILYGVTMQEAGISKIVSVKLVDESNDKKGTASEESKTTENAVGQA